MTDENYSDEEAKKKEIVDSTPQVQQTEDETPEPPENSKESSKEINESTNDDETKSSKKGDKIIDMTKKAARSAGKALGSSCHVAQTVIKSAYNNPLRTVKLIDNFLEWVRKTFTQNMFKSLSDWITQYGHAGIITAAALSLVYHILVGLRTDASLWSSVCVGVGIAGLLLILQYTASKFLTAGEKLVESSPSCMASSAFLDCLAILMEVMGIIIFVLILLRKASIASFLFGLAAWGICEAIGFVALHPGIANVEIDENISAGKEAIGIASFFIKAGVRTVPIAFGIGILAGLIVLIASIITLITKGSVSSGASAICLINICALLPFLSYIFFTFFHLAIDIIRAMLSIPDKLDKLNDKK